MTEQATQAGSYIVETLLWPYFILIFAIIDILLVCLCYIENAFLVKIFNYLNYTWYLLLWHNKNNIFLYQDPPTNKRAS